MAFLQQRLSSSILSALEKIYGQPMTISYTVEGSKDSIITQKPKRENNIFRKNMTFSNFVISNCNITAYKLTQSIIKNLGHAYNPFYLYGVSGTGKTHLINAIGNQLSCENIRAVYNTSEQFVTAFVKATQNNMLQNMRAKYLNIDILFIDDIGFVAGKVKTQSLIVNIIDELILQKKQVIVSGEVPLNNLSLCSRLTTRLSAGIAIEIESLIQDTTAKKQIIYQYLSEHKISTPSNVVDAIAGIPLSSFNELIGLLKKLQAIHQIKNIPVTLQSIQPFIPNIENTGIQKEEITPDRLINLVSSFTGLSKQDILSNSRKTSIIHTRWMTIHLLNKVCNLSLNQIGELIGDRNYQTVVYGQKKFQHLIDSNEKWRNKMDEINIMLTR